jgi:hypothetical protein
MIRDEDLENLSYEIDDIMHKLCIEYKISPLMFSSVMIARLSHLNVSAKTVDDFINLLVSVTNMDFTALNDKQEPIKVH